MRTLVVNIEGGAECDVYIGRAGQGQDGYFGNPCTGRSHEEKIVAFGRYFHARVTTDAEYRRRVLELKGKRLGCFCAPRSCHGDVIAAWLDRDEPGFVAKMLGGTP